MTLTTTSTISGKTGGITRRNKICTFISLENYYTDKCLDLIFTNVIIIFTRARFSLVWGKIRFLREITLLTALRIREEEEEEDAQTLSLSLSNGLHLLVAP